MKKAVVWMTMLLLVVTAELSAQQRQVIAPAEFGNQGSDTLPFSPGILDGDTLYVSGEIGFDLHTKEIPKDFDAEVKACLENIGIVLRAANMSYEDVDQVQVYLTDMTQFKRMNAVYASVFKAPRPARVTVGISALAVPNAHIEIMVTAKRHASVH
jgi:2-iminobutanoate/2-iminopropanoate deaminase